MGTLLINTLFDDCMAILDRQPMLVSQLERELRDGEGPSGYHWRKLGDLELKLEDWGMVRRRRTYASGVAIYVWHSTFTTVVDGRGKTREVF